MLGRRPPAAGVDSAAASERATVCRWADATPPSAISSAAVNAPRTPSPASTARRGAIERNRGLSLTTQAGVVVATSAKMRPRGRMGEPPCEVTPDLEESRRTTRFSVGPSPRTTRPWAKRRTPEVAPLYPLVCPGVPSEPSDIGPPDGPVHQNLGTTPLGALGLSGG